MLLRVARKFGLHVDPLMLASEMSDGRESVTCSAVEVESRRRLWHSILYIDVMICEPAGIDPEPLVGGQLWPSGISTKIPSSVSDEELETIDPSQLDQPLSPVSHVSLHSIRIYSGLCVRYITSTPSQYLTRENAFQRIESAIEQTARRLSPPTNASIESSPEQTMAKYLSIIVVQKLSLLYYQWSSKSNPSNVWDTSRRTALAAATQLLEAYVVLKKTPGSERFDWHFRRHSQLHATMYSKLVLSECSHGRNNANPACIVLDELCKTDPFSADPETYEACRKGWKVVEYHPPTEVLNSLTASGPTARGFKGDSSHIWRLVSVLKEQARLRWTISATDVSTGALGAGTVEQASHPLQSFDPVDFAALPNDDGVDYAAIYQTLGSAFNMDFL